MWANEQALASGLSECGPACGRAGGGSRPPRGLGLGSGEGGLSWVGQRSAPCWARDPGGRADLAPTPVPRPLSPVPCPPPPPAPVLPHPRPRRGGSCSRGKRRFTPVVSGHSLPHLFGKTRWTILLALGPPGAPLCLEPAGVDPGLGSLPEGPGWGAALFVWGPASSLHRRKCGVSQENHPE
jgi:hypothetical protein